MTTSPAFTPVALEAFKDLDGGVINEAFNRDLTRAAQDCIDHPGLNVARKVTLTIELKPVIDRDGCREVKASACVKHTLPTRKSRDYSFGVNVRGQMYFNPDAPDNIQQRTLLGDLEEAAGEDE